MRRFLHTASVLFRGGDKPPKLNLDGLTGLSLKALRGLRREGEFTLD